MNNFHRFCSLMPLIVPCVLFAKVHYISNIATGSNNGIDWQNAYTGFSAAGLHNSTSTLTRGDTFFVAGSEKAYPAVTFSNASSNTLTTCIIKATERFHGTEVGWNPLYGSMQARFQATVRFETSDWVFDGITGGGPYAWEKGYGFKVFDSSNANMKKLIRLYNAPSNIRIRHVDCVFEGAINGATTQDLDAVYAFGGSSNIVISWCALRYAGRDHVFLSDANGFTVEGCYLYSNRMCTSQHAQSWEDQGSSNVTIRNNFFRGCRGTGVIVVLSRGGTKTSNGWDIYGNIFYNDTQGYTTDGVVAVINGEGAVQWNIHNNTFIEMNRTAATGLAFSQSASTSTGISIYNNLWYNCGRVAYSGGSRVTDADYSCFFNTEHSAEPHEQIATAGIFKDAGNFDYMLSTPTTPGKTLTSKYAIDMLGNARGIVDGRWERGALEYSDPTGVKENGYPVSWKPLPSRLRQNSPGEVPSSFFYIDIAGRIFRNSARPAPGFIIVIDKTTGLRQNVLPIR